MQRERYWQALCERDPSFDGRFVFAVHSTGIYCRPSCPARRPLRENVTFYERIEQAEAAGYRPCKRCAPNGQSIAQQLDALVIAACRLLDDSEKPPTLAQLAARIGLSPSHLARAFKARTGMTPKGWSQARRQQRLDAALPGASSVLEAALDSGYGATRALYQHSQPLSPTTRRKGGAGETLRFATQPCPLGHLLLASSDKGFCALLFGDSPSAVEAELRQRFPLAKLLRDDPALLPDLKQVLEQIDEPQRAAQLPLDLRGTALQQQVWRALQGIPSGQTRTYGELAKQLGSHPRAIAQACASNPLGLVIPCHRVISASGQTGGYRWGKARKIALLKAESQASKEDGRP